jgi:hypothetical protein
MKIVITEESQRMAQSDAKYEFQRSLNAICNCFTPPSCCSDLFKLEKLLCGAYEHEHRLRKWHFHARNRFHTCSGRVTEAEEYSTSELEHGTVWSAMPNNSSLQPGKIVDSEYKPKGRICLDQGLLTS